MTVSDFIEWLKTQDQEALVEVVLHTSGTGYYDQGGTAKVVEFSPEKSEYTDFRKNQFMKPEDYHYEKRTLQLGIINA